MSRLNRIRLLFVLQVPRPPKRWAWLYPDAPYQAIYAHHRCRLIKKRRKIKHRCTTNASY